MLMNHKKGYFLERLMAVRITGLEADSTWIYAWWVDRATWPTAIECFSGIRFIVVQKKKKKEHRYTLPESYILC